MPQDDSLRMLAFEATMRMSYKEASAEIVVGLSGLNSDKVGCFCQCLLYLG